MLKRVQEFVDQNLAPPVQMMVVSSKPSLEVRQPFTDQVQAVLAAFETVADESGGRLVRDRDRQMIFDWMEESSSDARSDVLEFFNQPEQQINRIQIQAQILAYVEEESDILQNTLHQDSRGIAAARRSRRAQVDGVRVERPSPQSRSGDDLRVRGRASGTTRSSCGSRRGAFRTSFTR